MSMKKVMVGCLIAAALLIGGNGAVLASSLDTGTGVLDTNTGDVVTGNVVYSTHVQNVGWQAKVADGKMSGTEGRSLRLEGITIESGIEGVGIEYATHVQNIGWQDFVSNGKMSGTEGKSYRLEAIRIQLTGENADKYDVVYRVHAQNVGWMGYAMNGESSGTAGYGYRLEGIEIQIVKKGSFAGDTTNAYKDLNDDRTTVAYADAKYGNIINEYSQFVQNGAVNASNYKHVNINTSLRNRSQEPYLHDDVTLDYTYEDINGDGVYELFIAVSHTEYPQRGGYPFIDENHLVYDIYTINDAGEAVRIIEEPEEGVNKWYTLYKNNIVMTFNQKTRYCTEEILKNDKLEVIRTGLWENVNSLGDWTKKYNLVRKTDIIWKPVSGGIGQF